MSQKQRGRSLYGSSLPTDEQREAFTSGEVPVAVYGLGKMGLPLAAVYADVSGNVVGVDVDPDVVERLSAGGCHVDGEPGLPELVADLVDRGAFRATTDAASAAADATVHVVIVPTLLTDDGEPDLSAVVDVIENVGDELSPGDTVILESTVPPRTSTDLVDPLLEWESGLSPDQYGLAFCPERTKSGQALADVRGTHPKVVGGADDESTRVAELVYGELTGNEVVTVADTTTAEAAKLFEGLYRDVNIALANELATFADDLGIDVTAAIETANTQPFCDIHEPGPGVGGHCIPYYPYFLMGRFRTEAPLLRTARAVNDGMPEFVVRTLASELSAAGRPLRGATVLLLGLTYRPGVEETRATPARPIAARLAELGAEVLAVDPLLDSADGFDASMVDLAEVYDRDPDAAVLVTPHAAFDDLDWSAFPRPLVVLDAWRTLDLAETDHRVTAVGVGGSP
ncbi:MAG TPA: nucleotide sugar dehydrogenase [Halobacteriales archaeon]|nr:nucleotide sugar dehydrogenase [Halobacteriales archaeon]